MRWADTVKAIYALGVFIAAECGPGKVLTGLTKRIVADLSCTAFISDEAIKEFNS